MEALNAHPPKGMAPRLIPEQKAQISGLLAKGAEAYGFRRDVWTARRVAEVIHRTFGRAITAIMWADCYAKRAGGDNSRSSERRNATSKLSKTGTRGVGLPLKKAEEEERTIDGARRSRILSVADGSADLGALWADADSASTADTRSPFGHQWYHS